MAFLAGWWALAGLLAVPIVLLYLLKMRREPSVVSSTLLWQQALADLRANTPFQRLRNSLLLILQLLALALLVAALCRPILRAAGVAGDQAVIVLDASASMQTADGPEGISRFEHARRLAGELIGNMGRGDRMMLIVAGPPGVGERTPMTDSRTELRRVLGRARPYDAPAAVDDALRLAAAGLAAEDAPQLRGKVYLLSDGVGVALPDARGLADALTYVRVGSRDANAAITSLSVESVGEGRTRLLVGVQRTGGSGEVMVNLYYDNASNWIDARPIDLDDAGRGGLQLEGLWPPGRLLVRLDCDADLLALDSQGYVVVPQPRPLTVRLVSAGNPVLKQFLAVQDRAEVTAEQIAPDQPVPATGADVTIFDAVAPPEPLPAGDVLMIDLPGAAGGFSRTGDLPAPQIINTQGDADVMRFVNTADLKVGRASAYAHDGSAVELIAADGGPLVAYTTEGAARRYLVAFHLAQSTWATDVGLVIFLQNILDRARAAHYAGRSQMIATGHAALLPDGASGATVTDPQGRAHRVPAGVDHFAATYHAGFYAAERDGVRRDVAANLLSAVESDIAPRPLAVGSGGGIEGETSVARVNRPLWPLLAAVALAVLTVEWWCYHRRIGV
ncbi:MAG: VWA domain-containing protein [Planctomycetes bacterium]|nr:VWA domain-containing protein [Planctomycetota bacterium]